MADKKRIALLKVEGIVFALAIILFIVMFYFKFISKEFLAISILMFSAVLFSINVSVQQVRTSKTVAKFNAFLSSVLFVASISFSVYYYAIGVFSF